MPDEPDIHVHQREVQRLLGRALLRFQHLEGLLKKLVLARFVSSGPQQVAARFQKRIDDVMASPLGWLKDELFEKYVQPEGTPSDESELDKAAAKGHMAFQSRLSIPPHEHNRLKESLSAVHSRRNQVVHHFLDLYDLQSVQCCQDAHVFLEETHRLLDLHQEEFLEFARLVSQVHGVVASFIQSAEFDKLFESLARDTVDIPSGKSRRRRKKKSLNREHDGVPGQATGLPNEPV